MLEDIAINIQLYAAMPEYAIRNIFQQASYVDAERIIFILQILRAFPIYDNLHCIRLYDHVIDTIYHIFLVDIYLSFHSEIFRISLKFEKFANKTISRILICRELPFNRYSN